MRKLLILALCLPCACAGPAPIPPIPTPPPALEPFSACAYWTSFDTQTYGVSGCYTDPQGVTWIQSLPAPTITVQ